jgi:hypothetical protein
LNVSKISENAIKEAIERMEVVRKWKLNVQFAM